MTGTPRCVARPSRQPPSAAHVVRPGAPGHRNQCANNARWLVEVQVSGTDLVVGLTLCEADLRVLFKAVPGALSHGFHASLVDDPSRPTEYCMFPATICQPEMSMGLVPAHTHSDDEEWLQGRLIEEIGFGNGIYQTHDAAGDPLHHVIDANAGVRIYRLDSTPPASSASDVARPPTKSGED